MGASAWNETGPLHADFSVALRLAQEAELRKGDYDADSLDEMWTDEGWIEVFETEGTGTVLDLREVIGEDEQDRFATLRPMSALKFRSLLGVRFPTYADFLDGYLDERLPQPDSRASARCAVLYRNGEPSEIMYWGLTAD